MKNELTKQFVVSVTMKTIIFALFMFMVAGIAQSVSPVISNEMALSQMQNSNEMYVLMNTYNKVRPIVNIAYIGGIILFTGTIARDIFKFVKTINTGNEKEN